MTRLLFRSVAVASLLAASACTRSATSGQSDAQTSPDAARGIVKGHVRLIGTAPENPVIRMRADPMCDRANAGQRVANELVVASADGSLANVFVRLQGSFPSTAVPAEPVNIDQHGCVYLPRMVGIRVGQPLRVRNSDPGLHNVHGVSGTEEFNVGQPLAGMVNEFRLKQEGILRLQCDVHGWMAAFIGVVSHPYFAVTDTTGTFEIRNVPVGTQTVQAWHEQYGPLTATVQVASGSVATADFAYSAEEKRTTTLLPLLLVPSSRASSGPLQ